jgi:hypothetical protein
MDSPATRAGKQTNSRKGIVMAPIYKAPSNATAASPDVAATAAPSAGQPARQEAPPADARDEVVAPAAQTPKTNTQAPAPAPAAAQPQKFFKPKAQLDAMGRRIKTLNLPRMWDEYERIFQYVRNAKWGVSNVNGIPVDMSNPDHQFRSHDHIRAATWVEVAKKFNLDVRGDENQLWFQEPIIDEKTGAFLLDDQGNYRFKESLPVEGYSDSILSAPQENKKHWLQEIRPDLWKRWEDVSSSGGMVDLPKACSTNEIKGVLAMFETDLNMAQNAIAAMKPK